MNCFVNFANDLMSECQSVSDGRQICGMICGLLIGWTYATANNLEGKGLFAFTGMTFGGFVGDYLQCVVGNNKKTISK